MNRFVYILTDFGIGNLVIIMSPKRSLGDILCLLRFLLSPQTKLGDLLILHRFLLLLLLLLFLFFFFFFFFSEWTCPTKFTETDDPIFTKLHRKVDPHLKRCTQVLEFQNGRRCQGNREHMSKSLTSFISETAKGISTRLGIYNMKLARPWMLAHLKIIWQFHAHPVHQKVLRFFGPRYIGDDFLLGTNLVSFNRAVVPLFELSFLTKSQKLTSA